MSAAHVLALWQEGGLSDYSDAEALGVMKRILEIKRIVTGEDSHEAGDSRALVPVPQPGVASPERRHAGAKSLTSRRSTSKAKP